MNIATTIPIQNIYYLLCYAWNKLDERDVVNVSGIDTTNLVDLFAKVLLGGMNHLLKRGLDRGYLLFFEDTCALKGKISFNPTIKRNLLIKAQVHCEYDELSHNILHNRIIKSTIWELICIEAIDKTLKKELIGLYRRLHEIDDIKLTGVLFKRVQLHQNNSFYDFLLKICELIYDNLLVSEEPGKSKFRDFLRDERQMASLFEEFIRKFYIIEAPHYHVGREDISWDVTALDTISGSYLPKMTTDISIKSDTTKMIIDAKYYKEALTEYYDQEKIHSQNLYQIFAYLKNIETKDDISAQCTGLLLYPTVGKEINLNYMMSGHKLMIRTINLNKPWQQIHKSMLEILNTGMQNVGTA
jgi:5-methylcytosine-specific restriction enzyme subunit McrC